MSFEYEPRETARALLWRHGLPEDVIDGALILHAQELAEKGREFHRHRGFACDGGCPTLRTLDHIALEVGDG